MERLTRKERTGIIAFASALIIGLAAFFFVEEYRPGSDDAGALTKGQQAEFDKLVSAETNDTVRKSSGSRRSKGDRKEPKKYEDINPLKDKLKQKR